MSGELEKEGVNTMDKSKRRCLIVGGAPIEDYERIRHYIRRDDYVIFCDSGLKHREGLGVKPDLITGDFDSWEKPETDEAETIVLPKEKDDTDTVYAVSEALERGFEEFLLVGMTGRRLDHTLGNVYILVRLAELKKKAMIVDDYSEIEYVPEGETWEIDDSYAYFSLLAVTGKASGITIRNAKYELNDAEIQPYYQYAISNEVIPGGTASVTVKSGSLLLIRDMIG